MRVARILLEHGTDVNVWTRDGNRASRIGQVEVVRTLLKHGASTGAGDVDNRPHFIWHQDGEMYTVHSNRSERHVMHVSNEKEKGQRK